MVAAMVSKDHQFHVLAVDDSAIDRRLIEKLLKTSSFQVTVVDSPAKALRFLGLQEDEKENSNSMETVNLIITDYSMPGMTGFDLMRKVKESKKDIPVVVMSSEDDAGRKCLAHGADDFFLKPVKQSDVNKLRPLLAANSRNKWSSPIMKPRFQ